jgi:hypothetical protein
MLICGIQGFFRHPFFCEPEPNAAGKKKASTIG